MVEASKLSSTQETNRPKRQPLGVCIPLHVCIYNLNGAVNRVTSWLTVKDACMEHFASYTGDASYLVNVAKTNGINHMMPTIILTTPAGPGAGISPTF